MNVDWKKGLTQQELSEIERKLQYIDFLSSRDIESVDAGENCLATAVAALAMGGAPYEKGALTAMLGVGAAASDDSQWQRYAHVVEMLLQADADTTFDESRIVALYRAVWGDGGVSASAGSAIAYGARLSGRASRGNHFTLRPQLRELVERQLLGEVRREVSPLITIATFLYDFTHCDTWGDDKEYMSYLLELLLLRRCGCHWVRIYSPCRTMCDDMLSYRKALTRDADDGAARARWITYWIDHVYEAALRANDMLAPVQLPPPDSPKSQLNTRQRRILDYVGKHQPVKLADVVRCMHKESANTVKKDLYKLRDLGYVVTDGVLKGTLYYKG